VKIGSLFSGIGGFDLGLTLPVSWQVEQDKDCNRVLAHHWPDTQRFNNVKEVGKANLSPVDLICGGFPCQDLSVAGKRKGLDGERSGLWFEFARIIDELEPSWVLIENVPGILSSGEGRDFAIILQWLAGRGYCLAWRMFDSQYFGVAQRRKRVFIVGSFGDGRCAEVLFESTCCCGDTPPGRETGQEVAGTIGGGSTDSRRGYRADLDTHGTYITPTLRGGSPGGSTHGKPSGTDQVPFVVHANQDPCTSRDYALGDTARNAICWDAHNTLSPCLQSGSKGGGKNDFGISEEDVSYTLDSTGSQGVAQTSDAKESGQIIRRPGVSQMLVRRLTPL
jgi:site-specific DNA-cytosine methylase